MTAPCSRQMNMFQWAKKSAESFEKERSIKELKAVFPDIRRPNNDNNLFEILFDVQGNAAPLAASHTLAYIARTGHYSTLKIFIPTDYPVTKPVLQVMGPLVHPWLDEYKQVVGGDKLQHWTKTSSLADLVSTTLLSLQSGINQTNKPASQRNLVARTSQSQGVSLSASSSSNSIATYPGAAYTQQQSQPKQEPAASSVIATSGVDKATIASSSSSSKPPPPSYTSLMKEEPKPPTVAEVKKDGLDFHAELPEIPNAFPELRELSEVQLERLLQDSEALHAHMLSQARIDHLLSLQDDIRQSNMQQCLATMAMEQEYSANYDEYSAMQTRLKSGLKDYKERLATVSKKCSLTKTDFKKKVDKKMDRMDDESDKLLARFSAEDSLQDFLAEYVKARTDFHVTSLKASAIL